MSRGAVSIMAADDLAMQGARASAAIVWIYLKYSSFSTSWFNSLRPNDEYMCL